jgi:hypothetical protein
MATYEDSYKSQLQGVSQQIPRERLPGQVTSQDNMLSDTVTNLRRRLGAAFAYTLNIPNATDSSVIAWDTDLAGAQVQIILNTADGVIRILDSAYAVLATLPATPYLVTSDTNKIQVASVGDEFFLANTGQQPVLGASSTVVSPNVRGFAYVKTGSFSKSYDVKVQTAMGSGTYSFTTPNGATIGDAALSSPEAIAGSLLALINAATGTHGVTCTRDGAFMYFTTQGVSTNLAVNTSSGSSYMVASGQCYLRQDVDLPTRLPAGADGLICATGDVKQPRYYQYNNAQIAWLECGNYTSALTLTNVPVSITNTAGVWGMLSLAFEGRLAGDDTSNPNPDFITRGITGMGSYQGRLVLLAGSMVNMSGSAKPRRFYRSTVTALLPNDCINIGSSAASSAAYQYCVPFQKDLLLFSAKYQALVPGSNVAITPQTASVVPTSAYESDMTSKPVSVGRTMMYAVPRSKDFFGLMELVPSNTLDAQYNSIDSTAHLPKYMGGRMRFSVSSSVANMVLFASTGDRYALIVHEYTWQGEQKIQQAWHRWTFKYPVASAYFSGQVVHVLFVKNGTLVACTIDPRSGATTTNSQRKPYLDFSTFVTVTAGVVTPPAWLVAFDPAALDSVKLSVAEGLMAGSPVGATRNGAVLNTVRSFPDGSVAIGFPFTSSVSPTPPLQKDSQGVVISSNKLTILRYMVGTNNSAQYDVTIRDRYNVEEPDSVYNQSTLFFSSTELEPGVALVGSDSTAIVPARTNSASTSLIISSSGTGELNVVGLEYVAHYAQKIKRKQYK